MATPGAGPQSVGRVVVLALVMLTAGAGVGQGPSAWAQASRLSERTHAELDSAQIVGVAANLLDRSAGFSDANVSTLSRFLDLQARRATVAAALNEARAVVGERRASLARAQETYRRALPNLEIVRNRASRPDDVRRSCSVLYTGGDPRIFETTVPNCRVFYSPNADWYTQTLNAAAAETVAVSVLVAAMDSATGRVRDLDLKLDAAEASFDDDLRGKTAYLWALLAAGATSVVLLGLLIFGREDVRRMAFDNVNATELVTVLVVVMAVIFFGAIRTLAGESVAGLLGGIAGYVLGRQRERRTTA